MKRKIISLVLCFLLVFEQGGFAQTIGQLDISGYLSSLRDALTQDKFRPLHLRYLSYDPLNNNFKLLLDKGDLKDVKTSQIQEATQKLLGYFFVGISLPNSSFWVNLRPDSPDNIIDPYLAQTDVGKILLEADLLLKKDTAKFTSPEIPEGKQYWNKLYQKAEELFGNQDITIPTLIRPWIVPDEIIIRETTDSAYVYKATLKVMLEQDYLKNDAVYNFKDDRLKQLNEYSSQLIRELIIPKLTKEVNTSKKYASLRQVYYSLILAQWFKARKSSQNNPYSSIINRKNLANLTSKTPYSKDIYFKAYQKSFKDGEYNFQTPVATFFGQTIRSFFSGGITGIAPLIPARGEPTLIDRQTGARITVLQGIGEIATASNPYLLAADILEVAPDQRGIVLENLVVRLADGELQAQEVKNRVDKIEAAHRIAPGKLGPRNPDGTYTSTHTPEEIKQKAKEMQSGFTPDQRRNLMKYGLVGSNGEVGDDILLRLSKVIDARLNQIIDRKHSHIFSVIDFMKAFIAGDFESLLLTFKDLDVDREQYRLIIEELYSRYFRLSDKSKRVLEVATMLHDIGAKKGERDWMHNQDSVTEAEVILRELGCSEEFIKEVTTIILHHGAYANVGTDYLPKDFKELNDEQKDMLMLISIFDMSGRAEGNRATPEKIRNIIELRMAGVDKFIENRNLYQYRLGGFLSPVLFTTMEERERNFESISNILKEQGALTESFIENWNNLIRCYAFGIFSALGERSHKQFVDLIVAINRLVDEYRLKHEITDVIVDTDIDFMGLYPHSEKAPYIQSLSSLIQQGNIPISANIQDNTLYITIKLDDSGSDRTLASPKMPSDSTSSPLVTNQGSVGGIDFRFLPIVTQAIGNLSANMNSPIIENLISVNMDEEWQQIDKMVNSRITPSPERIKEYIQASCMQDILTHERDKILLCISNILRLEEERCTLTDPLIKDILVILESGILNKELKRIFIGKK